MRLFHLAVGLSTFVLAQAFIGIDISMYSPPCAHACRNVISSAMLDCEAPVDHGTHAHKRSLLKRHGDESMVTPECRSTSVPFLTTLAYCLNTKCTNDTANSMLEGFWEAESTGDPAVLPMWSFGEALHFINGTPTLMYDSEELLTETRVEDDGLWRDWVNSNSQFEWQETLNSRYSLAIVLSTIGLPIVLTLLTYFPFTYSLAHWVEPRFIYPILWRSHVQTFLSVFHIPFLGQFLFLVFFTVMTLVLSFVEHNAIWPNTWYEDQQRELSSFLSNRCGTLAMALLPLTILFAGRNNVLLWITNWSHSTYLLLHRWIGRLCLLEMVLHSLIELAEAVRLGTHSMDVIELYWIWGAIGTIACSILVIHAQFRKYAYELFIILHIILAIFVIAGTWYHVEYLFERLWGYEKWIYICCSFWFFDRLVRVIKIMKVGMKKAVLKEIGGEIIRVDVEGVKWGNEPGKNAYVYLPSLRKWAPWENHPFSVIPTSLSSPIPAAHKDQAFTQIQTPSSNSSEEIETPDLEKSEKDIPISNTLNRTNKATPKYVNSGITFFIKKNRGLTASFKPHHLTTPLTCLLDGPYRNTSSLPVLSTDKLILIGGGIGITGILPFIYHHSNVKIYWSVRQEQVALVGELEKAIPGDVERSIKIGERNDLRLALEEQVRDGWGVVGVVVCGPCGMCDDVRRDVSRLGRYYPKTKWELDIEAFLW